MKKIIFAISILIATVAMAEHYERVSVCIPLFGIPGTIEGVTYTTETEYVYHPAPVYYRSVSYMPPPPRFHKHHHHFAPPPPPPPPSQHGPQPVFRHGPPPKHPSRR